MLHRPCVMIFLLSAALPSYSCVLEGRGGRNARTHLWCLFLCSVRHALSYWSWLVWRLGCVNSSQGLQEMNSPNLLSALQPNPARSSPALLTWCVWRGNILLGSCTRTMLAKPSHIASTPLHDGEMMNFSIDRQMTSVMTDRP